MSLHDKNLEREINEINEIIASRTEANPNVPKLPPGCVSWIVVEKATGVAVSEVWDPEIVHALDYDYYKAIPSTTYLQERIKKLKGFLRKCI